MLRFLDFIDAALHLHRPCNRQNLHSKPFFICRIAAYVFTLMQLHLYVGIWVEGLAVQSTKLF